MKKFIKNYWKTALATLVICYICFAPPKTFGNAPNLFSNADKLAHFFMFFFLAITISIDYQHNIFKNKMAAIAFCWVFPVLFGLAIEGVQHFFLPMRQGDLKDWFFDCLGYIHGFVAAKTFFKIKAKTNGKSD